MTYPVDDPKTWPFEFAAGDRVADNDDTGTRAPLRVLRVLDESAADHEIEAVGDTVAALNSEHPPEAPVVVAVFENDLDSTITPWQELLTDAGHFGEAVNRWREEWGVPLRPYHYPATRLVGYVECDECEGGKGYAFEPEMSGFKGYLCLNDECPIDG